MARVNEEFQSAPKGFRGRFFAAAGILITFAVIVILPLVAFAHKAGTKSPLSYTDAIGLGILIVTVATMLVGIPIFVRERARVTRFAIEDNCLVVDAKRYPLEGLVEVARNPDIMNWAFKLYGDGGLGGIRGRFWSTRVGKFEAYLTDTDYAVVLRWPDRIVAVSPADPVFFITCAKSAAGLR
jgi:hypothetical protein